MYYAKGDLIYFMQGGKKIFGVILDYCEDTDKYFIDIDKSFKYTNIVKIRTHRIKPVYDF